MREVPGVWLLCRNEFAKEMTNQPAKGAFPNIVSSSAGSGVRFVRVRGLGPDYVEPVEAR